MKQILHNTATRLVIISLLSLVSFLFISAAFGAIETIIGDIKPALKQGNSFTYHLSHYNLNY